MPSDRSGGDAANPVLAVATRSDRIESWHRGAVAVVHDGAPVLELGHTARAVYARSAVKPLQALPLLERGLHTGLGLGDDELAVMCASHDGTDAHVAAVRSLLAKGRLDEGLLGCGPHPPFDGQSRLALLRRGEAPLRVHNNCSGKHSGFLLLAQACGDDPAAYLEPGSRTQQAVLRAVAEMAGVAAPLPTGVDGCGAPTFLLSLTALAQAFCRLANPVGLSAVRAAACRTILAAAGRSPEMLAGAGRLCTELVRCLAGRAFAKKGAEGVYAVALMPDPARVRWPGAIGIAMKIDDGNERGYQTVVTDLLCWLGVFGDGAPLPPTLQPFHRQELRNTQARPVGDVRCIAPWPQATGAGEPA